MSVKVIFVGQAGSGKTCIVNRIVFDTFNKATKSTIIQSVSSATLVYDDISVSIQITDLAGTESFMNTVPHFFHDAKIAILVFSIDSLKSFEEIDYWKKSISEELNTELESDPAYVKLILVGTKSDKDNERQVSREVAQEKARSIGCSVEYIEVSSLTGEKIKKLKDEIAKIAIDCNKEMAPFQTAKSKEIKETSTGGCC